MHKTIKKLAAKMKPDMIVFCQRLIQTPALSGKEGRLARIYVDEMKRLGYDQAFLDSWGNVIGIINGRRKGADILFNGHLDHVSPGSRWRWKGGDPYSGRIAIERTFNGGLTRQEDAEVICGLGAADVKGGAAAMVYAGALLIQLQEQGVSLQGRLIFTMTVMEEEGMMLGMTQLLEETLPQYGFEPAACISCEATGLGLYLGHNGRVELQAAVEGKIPAVRVMQAVEEDLYSTRENKEAHVARTILNGRRITWDRRFSPEETLSDCKQQILTAAAKVGAEVKIRIAAEEKMTYTGRKAWAENKKEAWRIPKDHPLVQGCARALQQVGQNPRYGYWRSGTDLPAVYVQHQIPSVGYSPAQEIYCHKPAERVRIDYMEQALAGYASIFIELGKVYK